MAELKKLRRKKPLKKIFNPDGVDISSVYCRKCMKSKPPMDFYKAADTYLDQNGLMSICRDCICEMYIRQYNIEHDIRRAIYKVCRIINILYSESAIVAVETQMKNKGLLPDDKAIFGWYKAKLVTTMKGIGIGKMGDSIGMDLTFQYENSNIPDRGEPIDFTGSESVLEFWGGDYSVEEYRFLEKELADWKRSYSCQNKAEEFFMKQVCLKSLELEIARKEGKPVDSVLKSMQELLKNASLTPAQQTAASSGKGVETWGVFIKNIEETSPAEYYKDRELFKDVDNIDSYIKKYITRPLKNFVTGSRDFNITDEDITEYDEPELEVENATEEGKTE